MTTTTVQSTLAQDYAIRLRQSFDRSETWSPTSYIKPDAAANLVRLFRLYFHDLAAASGNRVDKAGAILHKPGAIKRGDNFGEFFVRSDHNPLGVYVVNVLEHTCTCPDHPGITAQGGACKHRLAVGMRLYGHIWAQAEIEHKIKNHCWKPDYTEEEDAISLATEARRAVRFNRQYDATRQADDAWSIQRESVDRWEAAVETFGYSSREATAARHAMDQATANAAQLSNLASTI